MPRIFDNIDLPLLPALRTHSRSPSELILCRLLQPARVAEHRQPWWTRGLAGDGSCARLLVGMQALPQDELREAFSFATDGGGLTSKQFSALANVWLREFRDQFDVRAPTNEDEHGLRCLSLQFKGQKGHS